LKIGSLEPENYQRVPKSRENQVRIIEIGSLQVHIGYLISSLKKLRNVIVYLVIAVKLLIVALHEISEMIIINRWGYCLHSTYLVWGKLILDVNWSN